MVVLVLYMNDPSSTTMYELEHRYEVEIKERTGKQTLTKEVKADLKAAGMMDDKGKIKLKGTSPKMQKRMKQEFVECPVLKEDIHFIQCFVCHNFQSRVMGKVLCKGDHLERNISTLEPVNGIAHDDAQAATPATIPEASTTQSSTSTE